LILPRRAARSFDSGSARESACESGGGSGTTTILSMRNRLEGRALRRALDGKPSDGEPANSPRMNATSDFQAQARNIKVRPEANLSGKKPAR
jgi:hypothetical protein